VVANILSGAAAEGMNPDALRDAAGLRSIDLDDPDARVPLWAEVALWHLIAKRAADPGIAVRIGAAVTARHWGLAGYAMYYSATLGAALRRLVRYSRVLNDAIELRFEELSDTYIALGELPQEPGLGLPYAVGFRVAMLLSLCREITRAEIVPAEIALAFDPPRATLGYRRFFRCPLHFSQPLSRITFVKRDLDLSIPTGDETLAGYLSEHAERVLRTLVVGASLREQVRSAVWSVLSDGPPTLHTIASIVRLSPRTLQRRLASEGTTLRREVEYIREQMAVTALRERTMAIDEVAFILGYSEPSTFYRSFKRWTGRTPSHYRATAA
jgi:AraC-like DNA-binding protein